VCVSGTLLGPNAGVSCSASDWDYTGNCSSSGSGLWVVVAVVAPLLVIGGAVTMYKRYRRRQRQRTSYQPVQPVYGHVDVYVVVLCCVVCCCCYFSGTCVCFVLPGGGCAIALLWCVL